jgi:hypothetical protein
MLRRRSNCPAFSRANGRNPRHRAQKLADIADGVAADAQDLPRLGPGEIDLLTVVTDADTAAVTAVIAKNHFQDRRFAGAGGAGQHHAFAGAHLKRYAAHHGKLHATLQMHRKSLFGVRNFDHRSHRCAHAGKIEETSNWV